MAAKVKVAVVGHSRKEQRVLFSFSESVIVTWIVNTACDLEDAWLRLVEPTERCFVARLYTSLIELDKHAANKVIRTHKVYQTHRQRKWAFGKGWQRILGQHHSRVLEVLGPVQNKIQIPMYRFLKLKMTHIFPCY